MAEKLAELRQKGGSGIESNLFYMSMLINGATTWTGIEMTNTVNNPSGTGYAVTLDPDFGHLYNNAIVVDKAIPAAYISGRAFSTRNSSGTMIYGGVRVLKNGSVISGCSVTAASGSTNPGFRRVQTSLAVGDEITIQVKTSATIGTTPMGFVNIVTDD